MKDTHSGLLTPVNWPDEITIIPYSGIQMLDFGFDIATLGIRRQYAEQTVARHGDAVERMLVPMPADPDEAEAVRAALAEDDPEPYSIDARKALEPFLGEWVPVPVLRLRKERGPGGQIRFDHGPTAWARMRVVELERQDPGSGHTHRVQLALDTMLVPENRQDRYLAPERQDAENPREFCFVSDPDVMRWFLRRPSNDTADAVDLQQWVSDWIFELFREFLTRRRGRPVDMEALPLKLEHWARYLQYLAVIGGAVRIPRMRFLNTVSQRDAMDPVDVDLVLDIGNSRTCGILIERFPGETHVRMERTYQLEIRDLSRPEYRYDGLIESHVEFADLALGNERFAARSGHRGAFLWPSFLRVGPEARRMIQSETGTETISGLSSPKRYLWDNEPAAQDWRFHDHRDPNSLPRGARAAMQHLTETGDIIAYMGSKATRAIRPRFSKSALFGFMLSEIIAHALVQVNDPGSRSRRAQSDLPRRLSRIILTLPTATPVQEQALIRARARDALHLVWERLGIGAHPSKLSQKPTLIVEWDEASCTQLVFLYSEITQRLEGRIDDYLALKGKPRRRSANLQAVGGVPAATRPEPSLRLACIDVGGGTTDLMVTTYFCASGRVLEPHQTFREGFRIAGDDLVKAVIAELLLPQIATSAEAAGAREVMAKLAELFGADVAGLHQQAVQQRRQFALRVLRPLATAMIEAAETAEIHDTIVVDPRRVLPIRTADSHYDPETDTEIQPEDEIDLPAALLDYLEAPLGGLGAQKWRIADMIVELDRDRIDQVVRSVFQTALGNMMEVIDHLDADIVLLTGRPSRLPALRAIVEEPMIVPPDRLISMHSYRTDSWYPHRDPVTQRIGDPKSTVAVGGLLIALADNQLPNFTLRTAAFRMRSTARYIGEMELNGQIRNDRLLFRDVDLDRRKKPDDGTALVEMNYPVHIGARQLPLERWTTTPLYRLEFANTSALRQDTPLTVILQRPDDDGDDPYAETAESAARRESLREAFAIQPQGVTDRNGDQVADSQVRLRLHTMGFRDDYWLDTGVLAG